MKTKLFLLISAVLFACSGVLCLRSPTPVELTGDHPDQPVSDDIPPQVSLTLPRHLPPGSETVQRVVAETAPVAAPAPAPAKAPALKSLPSAEQQSLWKAFSEARHAVEPLTDHEKTQPQNNGVIYFARNPGQRLTARFLTDGGVRLGSSLPDRGWQVTLRHDTRSPALAVTATANRVEVRHPGGLTEWFENRPEGIEHGFTVAAPQGDTGVLEIPMTVHGLHAESDPDAASDLRFTGADGIPVIGYRGLKAWDISGKALAAEIRATADGGGLRLAVADRGARYPVRIDPLIVSLERKLTATDGAAYDYFGGSVALAGDTALIGVGGEDTAAGDYVGSAYVFVRSGSVWTRQAVLTAGDGSSWDQFGCSVALSGETALVGAWYDDTAAGNDAGSAYVFTRAGAVWTQQAKLTAGDGTPDVRFGAVVTLEGNTALVGATYGDTVAHVRSGSAYVFVRSGTAWTQQAELLAGDAAAYDQFGTALALAGDTALVGAWKDDTAAGDYAGSAYVFTRAGAVWTQQAKLTAGDGAAWGEFGSSVALVGDTALIGAGGSNTQTHEQAGSAYVFTRAGSVWTQRAKLTAGDEAAYAWFGASVALDGDTALIGAFGSNTQAHEQAGSAYVFKGAGAVWTQQAKLTAGDGAAEDWFGFSVALDGDTALVGAVFNNTAAGTDAGSAYVFRLRDDAAVPTYAAWAATAGLTGADAEPLAAPFDDGVENLLKYAFRMNGGGSDARVLVPGTGTAGLPSITLDRSGPVLRFEHLRRKGGGLGYTPQKSTDLTTWLPLVATPVVTDIDAAWERVVIAEPCDLATTPRLVGRVKVVLPP